MSIPPAFPNAEQQRAILTLRHILIECATHKRTLTHADTASLLFDQLTETPLKEHHPLLAFALHSLGDWCRQRGMPMLNSLVTRTTNVVAGHYWLQYGYTQVEYESMAREKKMELIIQEQQSCYRYWDTWDHRAMGDEGEGWKLGRTNGRKFTLHNESINLMAVLDEAGVSTMILHHPAHREAC